MSAYAVSFLDGQNIKMLNGNPDGWEVVTLEDLCTDIRAGFPSGERADNGIIQLRMNNITTDGHVSLKSYLRVPQPNDIEAYLLKYGDILFNNTNSVELVGKSAVFKNDRDYCTFSNHLTRIRIKENETTPEWILLNFIIKWSQGYFKQICQKHVGQVGIATIDLKKMKFSKPPLQEQRKIAAILSSVDEAIEKTEAILSQMEQIIAYSRHELLNKGIGPAEFKNTSIGWLPKSWDVVELKNLCTSVIDCPHSTPKFADKGVLVIRTPNVRNGVLSLNDASFTSNDEYNTRIEREIPQEDDILFTREAPIGEACLVPPNLKCCLGQRMMLLRPNKSLIKNHFLLESLYSDTVRQQVSFNAIGLTAKHINVSDVKKFLIPCPPILEQARIETVFSSLNEKLAIEKKHCQHLKNLKRGLMQDLLTGRVRVKVDSHA